MRRRGMIAAFAMTVVLLCTLLVSVRAQTPQTKAPQTYPTHTVRLILPFNPGSATDTTARLFADRLTARWGKPVIVENRPGGDGLVAMKVFVDAHDDHTLFFGPAAAFLVHLYDQEAPPYTLADIAPIAGVYITVLAVTVPTALNVNSMSDLVALARAEPGKLNVAAASGNSDFLIFGFLKDMRLMSRGCPIATSCRRPAILSESRIQVLSSSLAAVQSMMQTGRIKVLLGDQPQACADRARHSDRRGSRLPAIDHGNGGGLYGPKEMPDTVRESIAAEFREIAEHDPMIEKRLIDTGQIMTLLRPAEFAANIKEQNDQLAAIAKTLGLKTSQ